LIISINQTKCSAVKFFFAAMQVICEVIRSTLPLRHQQPISKVVRNNIT